MSIERDDAHNYTTDAAPGVVFPSVTTITAALSDEGMVPWARRHAIEYVSEHQHDWPGGITIGQIESKVTMDALREANLGTRVHAIIEAHIKGADHIYAPELTSDQIAPFMRAFRRFELAYHPRYHSAELQVVNLEHGFGGTVDALGYLADAPDELTVIDWKTSKRTWRQHELQIAAYFETLRAQGYPVERALVVQIRPDRFEPHFVDDLAGAFAAFLHVKQAWEWMNA